ncbi:Gstm5 [Symbiodinium pilosum]|uniref:Gstm5 protein n=1 Tax=Symbiodinium pilosum TaxID=2952 RepID=A0A812J1D3_SYMPI|nr:Gstm5 [Symbiodinium pilosum]
MEFGQQKIRGLAAQAYLNTILRYLGEKFGLCGASAAQKIRTEELLCEIYDVRNGMIDLVYPFKNVCRDKGEFDAKAQAEENKEACLGRFYSAYDRHNKRVGFAVARHLGVPDEKSQALLVSLNGAGEVSRGNGFLAPSK